MNILLIEDEQRIADFIVAGFTDVGFKTHWEQDGFRGLNTALIKNFDAIVLDLTLPMMDGLTVLAEIRRKNLALPVIILSARTDLTDRLQGFEKGADDYLAKPFFIEELIIRIRTVVSRKLGSVEKTMVQSGLTLDRFTRVAHWRNIKVNLTQREYLLLECLMLSPGQIFSRQQILKQVWQIDFDPGTNVVDVCVQRLRKKLTDDKMPEGEQFPIETIRGVGYRLNNY